MVEPQSFDKENLLECKRSSTTGFDNGSIKQSSDTIEKNWARLTNTIGFFWESIPSIVFSA